MSTPLIEAAYEYLALGLRVIPLLGKAPHVIKHPDGQLLFSHGIKDAMDYPAGVEFAFGHPDTTGIGIATGKPYYVVDIDGEVGAENWHRLTAGAYTEDFTWAATTGKGIHLWFAHWEEWPGTILAPNIDFKSAGGYVAAPPSLHPSGRTYQWLVAPSAAHPPIELPDVLVSMFRRNRAEREARLVNKQHMQARRGRYTAGDGTTYVTQSFAGVFKRVAEEGEGNRNHVLYWAARTLLEEGADDADFEELLTVTTLPRREALRTIRSAFDASE